LNIPFKKIVDTNQPNRENILPGAIKTIEQNPYQKWKMEAAFNNQLLQAC
jgi:hypothetical protein